MNEFLNFDFLKTHKATPYASVKNDGLLVSLFECDEENLRKLGAGPRQIYEYGTSYFVAEVSDGSGFTGGHEAFLKLARLLKPQEDVALKVDVQDVYLRAYGNMDRIIKSAVEAGVVPEKQAKILLGSLNAKRAVRVELKKAPAFSHYNA